MLNPEEFRAELQKLPGFAREIIIRMRSFTARNGDSYGAAVYKQLNPRTAALKAHTADLRIHRLLNDFPNRVLKASEAFYTATGVDVPTLCQTAAQNVVDEIIKLLESPDG
jgi:hypothetical protein